MPDSILSALDQARRELIDLTRRNRLLHAPIEGKRPWCLAVSGQSADDILEKLHRQESFKGYAFKARIDEDADPRSLTSVPTEITSFPSETSSARKLRLQTRIPFDKLQKRLAKISREERTLEEEQGISTLYLAIGFLKWFDSDQSEESLAPLLLVPVTMVRVGGADGYLLRGRNDDIVTNISLREKLKTNFDISLPDVPENEEWKPSGYFQEVGREIKSQARWKVEEGAIGLGFFTFSKFLMWRDLHPASWPDGALSDHPLVNILLGQGSSFESYPPLVPDDESIDSRIDISKCTHIVDADSSQALVIEEARTGRNLVVQGPPGTGKSQTITNAIASAVHSGKTVLFVAEKTAALEVVHERLRKAGLESLCLEIHSRKANKRNILKSLEQSLRITNAGPLGADVAIKLAVRRDQLNQWSNILHKPIGQSGRTAFEVIGRQVRLRAAGTRLLQERLDQAANWPATKLVSLELAVDRAAGDIAKLGISVKDHVWFGTNIKVQSPFDQERLVAFLSVTIEQIQGLENDSKKVIVALVDNDAPSISDVLATIHAFRHVAAVPKRLRHILNNSAWMQDISVLENAILQGEKLAADVCEVEERFKPEAWKSDAASLLSALREDGTSLLRRMRRRYRAAQAELRAVCRDKPPKSLAGCIALINLLQKGQDSRRLLIAQSSLLAPALGSIWAEHKSRWAEARELVAWARQAMLELGGARLLTFAGRSKDLDVYSQLADRLEVAAKLVKGALDETQKVVQASLPTMFKSTSYDAVSLKDLWKKLLDWRDYPNLINDWVQVRTAIIDLRSEGLALIADGLVNGTISTTEAGPVTELLVAESLWKRATQESPELLSIDGDSRNECVSEFSDLDQQRIRISRQEVLAQYLMRRPGGHAGAMGVIRAEINKKRGHRPIRRLVNDAGPAIQQLKPIFLMSPLSVAQFLPPGRIGFDILVIDEASQVSPEDALGVVARTNQILVVGDDKQLPPTNFFKTVSAGDEYDDEEDVTESPRLDRSTNFESILKLARTRGMSERMLAWHYRSKHPSLIALSNEECYGGRLLLPPSPLLQTSEYGLSMAQTPRGHYDRGGTRCDLVQAEQVAKAVANHVKKFPGKSLGVACLSIQQRDAVDDMIDKIGVRGEVEAFAPKDERLFVKNLEAVQGDERDVIFISVGYGVAPNQARPFLNFGPVSQEGGERRLNVLASRAREKCIVFSSITAADIPADTMVRGSRMLRALLDFAETGKLGAGTIGAGGFESPFEEAVGRMIREAGFHVHPQVGVKGFRIDLGVVDPAKPGEFILGVECDGATYHSARSARDRDRLRQQVLEGLGWRLHRIWSTDWFRNPGREADKLMAAISQAKESSSRAKSELLSNDDLPELDGGITLANAEDIALDDTHDVSLDDQVISLSASAVAYKECVLTAPFRRDLLEMSVAELSRFALEVVEAEGPIHTYEVARRIREAFRLQKTGKRIFSHVQASLQFLDEKQRIRKDGQFWTSIGQTITIPRNRKSAALSLRRAEMIASAEYQLALFAIIGDAVTISNEELVVETARLFGFDRTGADLKEVIGKQIERLVKEGRLSVTGAELSLADSGAHHT